jgi:hypothetical protein
MPSRILLALPAAVLGVGLLVGSAEASLLNSPSLSPDHGSPGTVVHVTGFPAVIQGCPTVRMYIASVAGITSLSDPRLHRLNGTVTYGLGLGEASAGPLVRVPLFRFAVPTLRPGLYATYWTCPGSTFGWAVLFEDQRPWIPSGAGPPVTSSYAAFRVEPLAPGATLPPTTTASDVVLRSDPTSPATWLLVGVLSIAGAAAALRRGSRRQADVAE